MTYLEQLRERLNSPNTSHAEWLYLKDRETKELKYKMRQDFIKAAGRTKRYGEWQEIMRFAKSMGFTPLHPKAVIWQWGDSN